MTGGRDANDPLLIARTALERFNNEPPNCGACHDMSLAVIRALESSGKKIVDRELLDDAATRLRLSEIPSDQELASQLTAALYGMEE